MIISRTDPDQNPWFRLPRHDLISRIETTERYRSLRAETKTGLSPARIQKTRLTNWITVNGSGHLRAVAVVATQAAHTMELAAKAV